MRMLTKGLITNEIYAIVLLLCTEKSYLINTWETFKSNYKGTWRICKSVAILMEIPRICRSKSSEAKETKASKASLRKP